MAREGEPTTRRGTSGAGGRSAFTLIELLVSIAIISILALAALPSLRRFHVQAKVSASRNNQRILADAIEFYRVDHGHYPEPVASSEDAFGVVSRVALQALTTPIAYAGAEAFRDPFGLLRIQTPRGSFAAAQASAGDPFRPPTPGFNAGQSLLYFHYPTIAWMLDLPAMASSAYAVVSVGPDLKDSFIVYYPFPTSLPPGASAYGVHSASDSVYDPTNGTISSGDLGAFGGDLPVPRFVGGGN
ncbi:MAG TPA: type II secretion system protein [Sumerlaeia bacterium]|nr:type II secretion system protein [Sumerlaeia bacterium]